MSHSLKCKACGMWFDMRNLAAVLYHEAHRPVLVKWSGVSRYVFDTQRAANVLLLVGVVLFAFGWLWLLSSEVFR